MIAEPLADASGWCAMPALARQHVEPSQQAQPHHGGTALAASLSHPSRQPREMRSKQAAENRKPERSKRIDLSGLWRGGANRNVSGPASVPESVSPGAPGQLESQGPLPSPRFGQPGCNGRYRRHAADVTGDSASRLGRQAVTLVVRQRTSGRSERAEINVWRSFRKPFDSALAPILAGLKCTHRASCQH